MISYIKGVIENIEDDKVVIDNNGIGYGIFMPKSDLENLSENDEIKIYTYFSVREDAMLLYGFLNKEQLKLYKMLIGVSGVGPKVGMAIISTFSYDELQVAIISGDSKTISKSPGVGGKTAQRIIIELKDKINIEDMIENDFSNTDMSALGSAKEDAISALVALGYSQTSAYNAVKKVKIDDTMDTEKLLKEALKNIL